MHASRTLPTFATAILTMALLAGSATAQTQSSLDSALKQNAATGFNQLLDAADRKWAEVATYRATFEKTERRGGSKEPMEVVDYKYMRDHGISMTWTDSNNPDKKVLYVFGKYDNKLNIQIKVFFAKVRVQKGPTDREVMEKTNHPITESGFGKSLEKIRALTNELGRRNQVTISYGGLVRGPSGQQCFKITRDFRGGTDLKKVVSLFDATTFMPVEIEAWDGKGWLEKDTYKNVKLNPKLSNGRDELTVRDFYRSATFPDDRDWGRERESWTFEQVARQWLASRGGRR